MARTYRVKAVALSVVILEAIDDKMEKEGRLGSRTAYISEILTRYASGAIEREVRAKLEPELRTKILQELQWGADRSSIRVRAHRPRGNDDVGQQRAAG